MSAGERPTELLDRIRRTIALGTGATTGYPEQPVHELFEAQAEANPGAVALTDGNRRLTYGECNREANRIAHLLRRLGVGVEVPVGIQLGRSAQAIVAMLGVLKAGGVYVPLDPAYPRKRLSLILSDTGISVLLTRGGAGGKLPDTDAEVIDLDDDGSSLEELPDRNPSSGASPDSLAYIMYTSGSTGRPKGCSIVHRAVVRLVRGADYAQLGSDEVFLQFAPLSFDASTLEIWGSLLNGARLEIFPDGHGTLGDLAEFIEQRGITTLWLTAALFHRMVDSHLDALRNVRQLLTGGDVLSPSHVQRILDVMRGGRLINGYGPTENTTFTCCHPMDAGTRVATSVPIGRPIANTRVYVVDPQLRPVPIGESGELLVGGDGLARDYLNRPKLTAERFIPDPFSDGPGHRVYRTGDLARFREDGTIDFLGRRDHQIKVRGFRVELGEIEACLVRDERVAEAAVVAWDDGRGEKRLVGYLVATNGGDVAVHDIRRRVEETLPAYMVPRSFVVLDEMPVTPGGKVDRSALPEPSRARPSMDVGFAAPTTTMERDVAALWSEVLGIDGIGVDDRFLSLGGCSLDAIRIVSRISETLGVRVDQGLLLGDATIRELAASIEQDPGARAGRTCRISPAARTASIPLSSSQERIWFIQQMAPLSRAYTFPAKIRLRGALDVGVLERCLSEIVRRHENWRTTYPAVDGVPFQHVQSPEPVTLKVTRLIGDSETERERDLQRRLDAEFRTPFDLMTLPLVRWTLSELGAEDHVLSHFEHHIVHDGWAFNIFLRELVELYRAFRAGQPSPLPEPSLQFVDFAVWQRKWMEGDEARAQLDYWTRKLAGHPPDLDIPTDHPRPPVPTFRGSSVELDLPVSVCNALRCLARDEGATFFAILAAVVIALLRRYAAHDDISIGSGVVGRTWPGTEELMGMIVNNVVLRIDTSDDPSFVELVRRVRDASNTASSNQDIPFDRVVDVACPTRDFSRNPLFQVLIGMHDSPMTEQSIEGLDLEVSVGLSNGSAKFDLTVLLVPESARRIPCCRADEGGLSVVWEYSTDLFEAETVEKMSRQFRRIVDEVTCHPGRRLSELPLGDDEHRELIVTRNDTATPYSRDLTVPELVARSAAERPGAVAAIFAGRAMTYRDLGTACNRVAHRLIELGVRSGHRVGLCLERSFSMPVGLLGVQKAGAAYVPLDPELPGDRLRFMLEDAGVTSVVTTVAGRELAPEVERYADTRGLPVVYLDGPDGVDGNPATMPAATAGPDDVAYVIYTSGSTGRPKGVEVTHRNVVNFLEAMRIRPGLSSDDVLLAVTTLSFDIAVLELLLPLIAGGTVVIAPREAASDGVALQALFDEHAVTVMQATPAMWQLLLQSGWSGSATGLRMLCGGEALPRPLAESLLQRGAELWNMYGPTETTVWSSIVRVEPDDDAGGGPVPIGRPIANTRMYVLGPGSRPVPDRAVGELCIGGDGVARGYLNRPGLTAERFAPDPFPDEHGARMYRTGDLVRYDRRGRLLFLGRNDRQVKLRGFRIELGEIESALLACPGVEQAAVLLHDDGADDLRLVAYTVGDPPTPPDVIFDHLATTLPAYMLPAQFVTLKAMPLSPSGKIDRRALPLPGRGQSSDNESVAPRTETERAVAGIWKEVLRRDDVGVHDDFFRLGGHSLIATKVLSRLSREFDVRMPLSRFFSLPTVARMAEYLNRNAGVGSSAPASTTDGGPREEGEI